MRTLVALFIVACLAWLASPLKAQEPPETLGEAKWLAKDAANTAHKIMGVAKKIADVNERGEQVSKQIDAHNKQYPGGSCYEDDPGCLPWVQEGKDLNTKLSNLVEEYRGYKAELSALGSHLAICLARLRLEVFLNDMTSWEQQVVACSKSSSPEVAAICLNYAWENHP